MYQPKIFVFLALCVVQAVFAATWSTLTPIGDQPHQVNKPNLVRVGNKHLVLFNGIQDNCNTGETTSYPNSQIYLYNTQTNTGKYIPASGDVPNTALFVHFWKSGARTIMTGGGVYYNVQFSVIEFKPFNPLYVLTIAEDYNSAVWTKVIPTGAIPSPRTEMSVIQEDDQSDEVFLYGGVSLSGFNFASYGEMYRYIISENRFELLHAASAVDDGSDGLPKSRYHAHIFITKVRGQTELEIHQGVHSGGPTPISEELVDSWRFNARTKQWRQIFPNPSIQLIRRHGVEFQLKVRGRDVFCTSLGDLTHVDEKPTHGCAFPIVTENSTVCSVSTENDNQGAWFTVPTTGPIVNSKYPGFARVGSKIYVVAGEREIPFDAQSTQQVFNSDIRVLDFSDYSDSEDN